nr:hypothetical protein [Tanacetum cinerariifolium]
MVSSLNDNEIEFRISLYESDDEDYMVIYDKISLSDKIIFVNDLKIDFENDDDKVNMPSFLLREPEIDSLLDEFAGELTILKSIPLRIDKTDCYPEEYIHLVERLLYDNSSPRPPEEFVSENSNVEIESFSPSPILVLDSDSLMEEIDLPFNPDDPMPPGIEDDDYDSGRDISILE